MQAQPGNGRKTVLVPGLCDTGGKDVARDRVAGAGGTGKRCPPPGSLRTSRRAPSAGPASPRGAGARAGTARPAAGAAGIAPAAWRPKTTSRETRGKALQEHSGHHKWRRGLQVPRTLFWHQDCLSRSYTSQRTVQILLLLVPKTSRIPLLVRRLLQTFRITASAERVRGRCRKEGPGAGRAQSAAGSAACPSRLAAPQRSGSAPEKARRAYSWRTVRRKTRREEVRKGELAPEPIERREKNDSENLRSRLNTTKNKKMLITAKLL